jgi:hypothetical protein
VEALARETKASLVYRRKMSVISTDRFLVLLPKHLVQTWKQSLINCGCDEFEEKPFPNSTFKWLGEEFHIENIVALEYRDKARAEKMARN